MKGDRLNVAVWIILIVAIVAGMILVWSSRSEPVQITIIPPEPTATAQPTPTPAPIQVYVTGAVAEPESLVMLDAGSRTQDAIDAAGGSLEDADLNRVNLAGILRDGDQVHVFSTDDTESVELAFPTPNDGGLIAINTATVEELDTLPGIGPSTAQRIIDHREAKGPFSDYDDLLEISGIGEATVEALQGLLRFD